MKSGVSVFLVCVLSMHLSYLSYGFMMEDSWLRPQLVSASNDETTVEYATSYETGCGLDSNIYQRISSRPIHITMDTAEYLKASLRTPLIRNDIVCSQDNFNAVNPCAVAANGDNFVVTKCYDTSEECICDLYLEVQKRSHDVVVVVIIATGPPDDSRILNEMNGEKTEEAQNGVTGSDSTAGESGGTVLRAGDGQASQGDTKKFDPGIITHAVLVVLAVVAFVGNAMFVLFVFWLSR